VVPPGLLPLVNAAATDSASRIVSFRCHGVVVTTIRPCLASPRRGRSCTGPVHSATCSRPQLPPIVISSDGPPSRVGKESEDGRSNQVLSHGARSAVEKSPSANGGMSATGRTDLHPPWRELPCSIHPDERTQTPRLAGSGTRGPPRTGNGVVFPNPPRDQFGVFSAVRCVLNGEGQTRRPLVREAYDLLTTRKWQKSFPISPSFRAIRDVLGYHHGQKHCSYVLIGNPTALAGRMTGYVVYIRGCSTATYGRFRYLPA
jgi:hypothetical protein